MQAIVDACESHRIDGELVFVGADKTKVDAFLTTRAVAEGHLLEQMKPYSDA